MEHYNLHPHFGNLLSFAASRFFRKRDGNQAETQLDHYGFYLLFLHMFGMGFLDNIVFAFSYEFHYKDFYFESCFVY